MKRERPDVLETVSQRIETGQGRVYVNVNVDKDGVPFEVFVNTGDSGTFTNGWTEALGKTVSNALRLDTDDPTGTLEVVAEDLLGIRSDRVGIDNGDDVYSIPDAVGLALKRFCLDQIGESIREENGPDVP